MNKIRFFVGVLLVFLLCIQGAWSQVDKENSAVSVLRQIEEKYKDTKTFTGSFNQLKKSEIFLEEIKSKGRFFYKKPDRFRCDYLPPYETMNLFVKDMVWIYVPELRQVEKYYIGAEQNLSKSLNQMLIGFGTSTDDLLETYVITTKEETNKKITISLVPKKSEKRPDFKEVIVRINAEELLPEKFIVTEINDDVTEITITELNDKNPKIPEEIFNPKFPKDVEIIEQD